MGTGLGGITGLLGLEGMVGGGNFPRPKDLGGFNRKNFVSIFPARVNCFGINAPAALTSCDCFELESWREL